MNQIDELVSKNVSEMGEDRDFQYLGKRLVNQISNITGHEYTPIKETDEFILKTTGLPYDFIAFVENKTNDVLVLSFDADTGLDPYVVEPNNWNGLLSNGHGLSVIGAIVGDEYEVNDPEVLAELGLEKNFLEI